MKGATGKRMFSWKMAVEMVCMYA